MNLLYSILTLKSCLNIFFSFLFFRSARIVAPSSAKIGSFWETFSQCFFNETNRCTILESMELILIGKIGKFSHEKCKSVFWTYVRRIVPLVIRRIISPSVYHVKIIFSREIRLSNVTLLLIHNCVCKRKKLKNSL
jgi:hypothetical protein